MWLVWNGGVSEKVDLIEANGVETKAQVEKTNGDTIEDAKEHHRLHVYWFTLKQIEPLRRMEGAKCYHQMPAR